MSKHPNISEETAALQRREALETRPQDRYVGRRKFTGCRRCGSRDGMQNVHRDELRRFATPLSAAVSEILMSLYSEPGNSEYLFYACYCCNRDRVIPNGLETMSLPDVLHWIGPNTSMAPDYAVLTSEDSRESAGI